MHAEARPCTGGGDPAAPCRPGLPRPAARRRARRRGRTSSRSRRGCGRRRALRCRAPSAAARRGRAPPPRPSRRARSWARRGSGARGLCQRHRDHEAPLHAARELVGVSAHYALRIGDLHPQRGRARSAASPFETPSTVNASATCVPTLRPGSAPSRGSGTPSRRSARGTRAAASPARGRPGPRQRPLRRRCRPLPGR